MSRSSVLYLEDMVKSCDKILRYINGYSFDEFVNDERTYDAVIRNLEILGEASRNISDHVKIQHPIVEWRAISALRNIVSHVYFHVKDEIIWDVVSNKVGLLKTQIENILNEKDSGIL